MSAGAKTVSNQRFVFQGSGAATVTAVTDENSQSNTAALWHAHVQQSLSAGNVDAPQAPASRSANKSSSVTLNTALMVSLAANRFKRHKTS